MTTVTTYIELPGTFSEDDDALEVILQHYSLRDWVAICNVISQSHDGAVVDVEPEMGDLYYDPELQTFLFTVEETEEREEAVWVASEDGPLTNIDGETGDHELEVHEVTVTRLRAASFVKKEQEDA